MAANIPADKRVIVYAEQAHLSGKKAEHGGIPKYLLERGINIYSLRQYLASEGYKVESRSAVSRRMVELVKLSPKLMSLGSFAVDISKDEAFNNILRNIYPGQNPEYFGDGFTFSLDSQ